MDFNRKHQRVACLLDNALRDARRLAGGEERCHVALALYDSRTGIVASFAHSGEEDCPLPRYERPLRDAPELALIASDGRPQVIEDLSVIAGSGDGRHAALQSAGFRSSLTMSMKPGGVLTGFMFVSAKVPGLFTAEVVSRLEAFLADLPRFLLRELERDVLAVS